MTFDIMNATKLDSEDISKLYEMVWTPYREIFPDPLMDDRILDPGRVAASMDEYDYYVIWDNSTIVGVVRVQFIHETCHMDRMVVHPGLQGRGIGRELTQYIIDLAKEKGVTKIWLDTSPKLEGAVKLYESMGFKESGFLKAHYWGEDIRFYELLL